jgi:hypothetical protein
MMTGTLPPQRSWRHTSKPSRPEASHRAHDVHRGFTDIAERRLTGSGGAHILAETAQSQLQALRSCGIVLDLAAR